MEKDLINIDNYGTFAEVLTVERLRKKKVEF